MKGWSLKTRFGLAAACLSVLALVTGLLIIRPLVHRQQLQELDEQLEGNAEELFRDIENFSGAPRDFRKPMPERLIPAVLRGRYIQIDGPEGQVLYRSANLRGFNLTGTSGRSQNIVIAERECRIASFEHGFLTVHLGTRLGTIEAVQEILRDVTLWVAPAMGLFVFGLGWLLGHRALRPVSTLMAAAEKIDASAPDERLPLLDTSQEIIRLTEVLNHSYDRLQAAYASAARFSADASHQLKTPLAVLRAGLDNLRARDAVAPELRNEVDALLKQTRRLTTLTEDLLLLAQLDAGRLKVASETLDLAALSRGVLDDLETLAPACNLTVESDIPDTLPALGDARRTAVILQNLAENAAKYAGEGGRIRIVCAQRDCLATVSIANTGPAIQGENRARLFERLYRAGTGEGIPGHGLGLSIARALAHAQGGDVLLTRSDGEWTEFQIHLPTSTGPRDPGAGTQ